MANQKLSELNAATAINPTDYLYLIQGGVSKKVSGQTLFDSPIGGVFNVKSYGAIGDGVTDDTAAIQAAIDACPAGGKIVIPKGTYKFTSTVELNKSIAIVGVGGRYGAILTKYFNGNGIEIITDYVSLLNIAIECNTEFRVTDTGSGLVLGDDQAVGNVHAHYVDIDVSSTYHGLHGIDCQKGDQGYVRGHFDYNGVDGVHCESEWAGGSADWNANVMEFSAMANGRHGLYVYRAEANRITAVCQGNGIGLDGGYGAYVNWVSNNGFIYAEGNVTGQVIFGASGYGNNLFVHSVNGSVAYDNHKNVGYIRNIGSGLTDYFKLFYAQIKNAIATSIPVSGSIPANGYTDFTVTNAYGATAGGSVIVTPGELLAQGITYEARCTDTATVILRVHNNTGAPIIVGSTSWAAFVMSTIPL